MRATAYPDTNDETEGEEVPRAFIYGTSDSPIPLAELDPEGISLTNTDDFDTQSPVHVFIAGINPSEPESVDAPAVNLPETEHIPIKPEGVDAPAVNFPNTEHILIKPEQSIQQWIPPAPIDEDAGTEVPTIDIIINSASIMSIREYIHSRGRIEMYFTKNHTGYFLFSCVITPNPMELLVCDIRNKAMRVKKYRRKTPKKSPVIWADEYYGILHPDYEWSPLQRCEIFQEMSRRRFGPGERYTPIVCPEEVVQPVQRERRRSLADFFLIFARIAIPIIELLVVAALPIFVAASVGRFILLVQALYRVVDGDALIRESARYGYCFLKSTCEHWPRLIWFLELYHITVDYDFEKCY
ncbi:hypothetical protein VE03_03876 [Pseudogymnoascus sp. 23342-1-I1]|nr:hypothetical protein VE03_03876 [Pseudogymnoascus sp. 23342-1-I1]